MSSFSDILRDRFGEDEPIFTEEIIDTFPDISRVTLYKRLDEALQSGVLERYDRGVYFIPREGILGKVPLLPLKVIKKKYLSDDKEVYGYLSGLNLENEIGVSPQVPATLEVTTNNASRRVREIEPFGGWRKIILRVPRLPVSEENVDALRFLDTITRVSPAILSDFEFNNLRSFATSVDKKTVYECASFYPARTSKRLIESEALGVFT